MPNVINKVTTANAWNALTLDATASNTDLGVDTASGGGWTLRADSTGQRFIEAVAGANSFFRHLSNTGSSGFTMENVDASNVGSQSFIVEFNADLATYAATTGGEPLRILIGTTSMVRFYVNKGTGNKQGIRIFISGATDQNQDGSFNDTSAFPLLEFNRKYRITIVYKHDASGYHALYIDGRWAGQVAGDMVTANTATGLKEWLWTAHASGTTTGIKVRIYPEIITTVNDGWRASSSYQPNPANLTSDSWEPARDVANGVLPEGRRLGFDFLNGTPTMTLTTYASSGVNPYQSRWVASSGSAGHIIRSFTSDGSGAVADIGVVPSLNGWRWVWWPKEYVPNDGSVTYAVRTAGGGKTGAALLAVTVNAKATTGNYVCEGTTTAGRVLADFDGSSRYAVFLGWNDTTGETRYVIVDLTKAIPTTTTGRNIISAGKMAQLWPTGTTPGPVTATYTLGGAAMDVGQICAGVPSIVFGDSYTAADAASLSPVAACLNNSNIGEDLSFGQFVNNHPHAWRGTKPADTAEPDVIWWVTAGRSGTKVEDFGPAHRRALSEFRGFDVLIPCYIANSLGSIAAATRATFLSNWTTALADGVVGPLIANSNRVIYLEPVTSLSAGSLFVGDGAPWMVQNALASLLERLKATYSRSILANLRVAPIGTLSTLAFIGNGESAANKVHIKGGTWGSRKITQAVWPGKTALGAPTMLQSADVLAGVS